MLRSILYNIKRGVVIPNQTYVPAFVVHCIVSFSQYTDTDILGYETLGFSPNKLSYDELEERLKKCGTDLVEKYRKVIADELSYIECYMKDGIEEPFPFCLNPPDTEYLCDHFMRYMKRYHAAMIIVKIKNKDNREFKAIGKSPTYHNLIGYLNEDWTVKYCKSDVGCTCQYYLPTNGGAAYVDICGDKKERVVFSVGGPKKTMSYYRQEKIRAGLAKNTEPNKVVRPSLDTEKDKNKEKERRDRGRSKRGNSPMPRPKDNENVERAKTDRENTQ